MKTLFATLLFFAVRLSLLGQDSGTLLFSQNGLSGAQGSSKYFSFVVPPGSNTIVISGSLQPGAYGYVRVAGRYNQVPTVSDLSSEFGQAAYNAPSGTWYMLVYGDTPYSGINIQVTGFHTPSWQYAKLSGIGNAALNGKHTALPSTSYSYFNYYKGTDNKIWALYYGAGIWNQTALTSTGNVDDWFTENTAYNQIYYKGTDNHIWALWYGAGKWNQQALTSIPNVAGNLQTDSGTNFTYYRGTDNNLWVLWYGAGKWNQAPLTSSAKVAGDVVVDTSFHFAYYRGSDSHLWVVWYGAGRWNEAKLSINANVAGNLVVDPNWGTYYLDSGNAVWAVWFTGTQWAQTNLGVVTGPVSGLMSLYGHVGVVYTGTDGAAHYLGNNGVQWSISQIGESGLSLSDTLNYKLRDGFIYGRTTDGNLGVFYYQ